MSRIPRYTGRRPAASALPHNLPLFRLQGFRARSRELHRLQHLLLDTESHPVLGLTGPAGMGKSALAVGAAWSAVSHFRDGAVYAAPVGRDRFRFYDVIRQIDATLGTDITGRPPNLWRVSVREQLYRRSRLLILDDTETAVQAEWEQLRELLQDPPGGGSARVLIISEEESPLLRELTRDQILRLSGLTRQGTAELLRGRGVPETAAPRFHDLTQGSPLALNLLLGLGPDAALEEHGTGSLDLEADALQDCRNGRPAAYRLLELLSSVAGEASYAALRDLFWRPGSGHAVPPSGAGLTAWTELPAKLRDSLETLFARGLLEHDPSRRRVFLHPRVRQLVAGENPAVRRDWFALHARYYGSFAARYERLDIEQWTDVDREWANIRRGADWCAHWMRRLWGQNLLAQAAARAESHEDSRPATTRDADAADAGELALVRGYGFAMALHAFYRHPPRSLDWIAAGALACADLADYRGFGRLLLHLGRQLFFRRRYADSLFWLQHAQQVFERRDMVLLQAYAHTDIGMVHRALGEPHRALRHCSRAYDCLAQGGNLEELGGACLNLGSLALSVRDFTLALYQYRNALRLAQRLDNRRLMADAYNNLGLLLETREDFPAAQAVYERALELYRYLHLGEGETTALNNLGTVAFLQEQDERAEARYREALDLCAARGAWLDLAATQHNLGTVLLRRRRREEADAAFAASRDCYRALQLPAYAADEASLMRLPAG